jgi:hypothetical protein
MGTFSATFTLTVGSSANVGGFNITGNPGSVSIATGVSRTALAGGVSYNDIADTITEFTITSTGDCTNSVTKLVDGEQSTPSTFNCNNGACTEVFDGSGTYSTLSECQSNCIQTNFFCKADEFSPCLEQLGPCSGNQISCGEVQN